jgi:hypothetical protein
MTFNIFVSYSTHDLPQVELLRQQLKATPIEIFIAEHSVAPSQELAPTISNAIGACDLFVLLWSTNAKESEWVSQEIGRASALGKPILPLVLSEGIALPGFIQGLKYLPIHKDPSGSLSAARLLIHAEYQKKEQLLASQAKEKKDKEALALMGIGAFLLWAFSK